MSRFASLESSEKGKTMNGRPHLSFLLHQPGAAIDPSAPTPGVVGPVVEVTVLEAVVVVAAEIVGARHARDDKNADPDDGDDDPRVPRSVRQITPRRRRRGNIKRLGYKTKIVRIENRSADVLSSAVARACACRLTQKAR